MTKPIQLSLSTQSFPTSQPFQPSHATTSSLSEGELIGKALTDWLAQTHRVPQDQRGEYQHCARDHIDKLRIQLTFLKGNSEEIKLQIQGLISQYETSLNRFYSGNAIYAENQAKESLQNSSFAQRLEKRVHSFGVYQIPQTSLDQTVDPLQSLAQQDILGAMAGVHFVSATIETVGDVFLTTAKAACNITPGTRQACKSTLEFAKHSGKALLEVTGTKEILKEAIAYWKSCDGSSLAEVLEKRYGFPKEQAEVLAHHAAEDVKEITVVAGSMGAASLAIKGAKYVVSTTKSTWTEPAIAGKATAATAPARQNLATAQPEAATHAGSNALTEPAIAGKATVATAPATQKLLTAQPEATTHAGSSSAQSSPFPNPHGLFSDYFPTKPIPKENARPRIVFEGGFAERSATSTAEYYLSSFSNGSTVACFNVLENSGGGALLLSTIDKIKGFAKIDGSKRVIIEVPDWNGRLLEILRRRYNFLGTTETSHWGSKLGYDRFFHRFEVPFDRQVTISAKAKPTVHDKIGGNMALSSTTSTSQNLLTAQLEATTHAGNSTAPTSTPATPQGFFSEYSLTKLTLEENARPRILDTGEYGVRSTTSLLNYTLSKLSDRSTVACFNIFENSDKEPLLLSTIDKIKGFAKIDGSKRVILEMPDWNTRLLKVLNRRYNFLGTTEISHWGSKLDYNRLFHRFEIPFDRPVTISAKAKPIAHDKTGGNTPLSSTTSTSQNLSTAEPKPVAPFNIKRNIGKTN